MNKWVALVLAAVVPLPARADPLKVTPLGYVETDFSWNFNEPSNGITNYRGFDNRHDTFTLSNVALGADVSYDVVSARLVLQVGHTPDTYYLSEPTSPGTSTVGATDGNYWKFVQEAYVGWLAPVGRGLQLHAGLFLSPIGAESLAVKDSWNWSRSNMFFGLPFYHTGLRGTYDLGHNYSVSAGIINGWNSVVDDNTPKSFYVYFDYNERKRLHARITYMGGIERPAGAPEGPYWRSDFDTFARWDVTKKVSFIVNANGGFEPNRFGTSSWVAGAIYARVKVVSWLRLAARAEAFYEYVPAGASAIFWPVDWVTEGTVTADFRPSSDHLLIRVEYRHDRADGLMFFAGQVGPSNLPNARSQDTVTVGATAWF